MEKPIKPGRVAALACLLALLVIVFVVALYKLQIVDGKAYYEENRNSVASSQTVEAARGSILDRYGRVLVSNTSCNNLTTSSSRTTRTASSCRWRAPSLPAATRMSTSCRSRPRPRLRTRT